MRQRHGGGSPTGLRPVAGAPFRHEAFLYRSDAEYVETLTSFITQGLDAAEAVMVAVSQPKIEVLRRTLGSRAQPVLFVDMPAVGTNPARIIPLLRSFVAEFGAGGRAMRGVGEPVWAQRSSAELGECHLHEALLNHAFGDAPGWLLCPYDIATLDPTDVAQARETHPFVWDAQGQGSSGEYGASDVSSWFTAPLTAAPHDAMSCSFTIADLAHVRALVAHVSAGFGLAEHRIDDLVLAVSEAAGNSIRHAGGEGTLRLWAIEHAVIAEVRDAGLIGDPMVGRRSPDGASANGRGLWLVSQVCDLVELRATPGGTVVRMHIAR